MSRGCEGDRMRKRGMRERAGRRAESWLGLLLVLALTAGACGNRTGDGDDAAPETDGGEDGGEVDAGESTDVGVTGDSITIGVIADLTGVVPGLFKAAPDAVKAFAAMVNEEEGGINGRE